jgi:hypothetical protein
LLKPRDSLPERSPASFPVCFLKLGLCQPAEECSRSDPSSVGRLLNVALGEQRSDGFLLLPAEFLAVSCHQVPPDAISGLHIAVPSPVAARPESTCFTAAPE